MQLKVVRFVSGCVCGFAAAMIVLILSSPAAAQTTYYWTTAPSGPVQDGNGAWDVSGAALGHGHEWRRRRLLAGRRQRRLLCQQQPDVHDRRQRQSERQQHHLRRQRLRHQRRQPHGQRCDYHEPGRDDRLGAGRHEQPGEVRRRHADAYRREQFRQPRHCKHGFGHPPRHDPGQSGRRAVEPTRRNRRGRHGGGDPGSS